MRSADKTSIATKDHAESISPRKRHVVRPGDTRFSAEPFHGTLTAMEIAHAYDKNMARNLGVEDRLKTKQLHPRRMPNQVSFGAEDFGEKRHQSNKLQVSRVVSTEKLQAPQQVG